MVKVLHVISSPAAGGAEIYVKDLAIAMAKQSIEVHVGYISRARDLGRSEDFEEKIIRDLSEGGVNYFFIGHIARKFPILGIASVYLYCRRHKIEIYHSHLKYAIVFGLLLRIPHIHTHHSIVAGAGPLAYRLFNVLVDRYIGISRKCAEKLQEYTTRTVSVIFNGIDRRRMLTADRGVRCPTDKVRCIAVGRIQPPKNYQLLIRVLGRLEPDVRSRISVQIAGEGHPDAVAELQSIIDALNVGDCVTLLGNRGDIPELLSEADLFLMSSAWEGLPIALLEATASGLPFIATDVGGCAEIADLCHNGIIVSPDDEAAFSEVLTSLVKEPSRLTHLSRSAVENAGKVDIKYSLDAHIRLYDRLIFRK